MEELREHDATVIEMYEHPLHLMVTLKLRPDGNFGLLISLGGTSRHVNMILKAFSKEESLRAAKDVFLYILKTGQKFVEDPQIICTRSFLTEEIIDKIMQDLEKFDESNIWAEEQESFFHGSM